MCIKATAWALDVEIKDPTTKLVLIALANFADPATAECYPWISTIARQASISERTVHRRLIDLRNQGFIIWKRRKGRASLYRVLHRERVLPPVAEPPEVASLDGRTGSATAGRQEPLIESLHRESDASLANFYATWGPSSATDNAQRTMRAWGKLTTAEREAAVAGIGAFRAEMTKAKRTYPIATWRYVEDRKWETLQQAADAAAWVDVKALTRDWWAALFWRVEKGEKIGFFLTSLDSTRPWPIKRDQMPSIDQVALLEAYRRDGEVMARWEPWLRAHGIRIPVRDALWVFLPSSEPPEPGVSVWKGTHHVAAR